MSSLHQILHWRVYNQQSTTNGLHKPVYNEEGIYINLQWAVWTRIYSEELQSAVYNQQSTLKSVHSVYKGQFTPSIHWKGAYSNIYCKIYTQKSTLNCPRSSLHWKFYTKQSIMNILQWTVCNKIYNRQCTMNCLHWAVNNEVKDGLSKMKCLPWTVYN